MQRRLISYDFYVLLGLGVFFILINGAGEISYICGKAKWLEWFAQMPAPLPTVGACMLLFAPPVLLGLKSNLCTRRDVLLRGILFNLSFGIIGNLFGLLSWHILMDCRPDIYTRAGFQFVAITSWLVLPIGALLGGVAALIGYKWNKTNLDKKGKSGKR